MVSPPSKLKMFTGSACVLLTSVSLKLIKIKLIYATTSSWEKNKMAGERQVTPTDLIFLFFFYNPSWSESNFILFLFFYSIRIDPARTGAPDFCTCLAKMLLIAQGPNNVQNIQHKLGVGFSYLKRNYHAFYLAQVQTSCFCRAELNPGIKFDKSTAEVRRLNQTFELSSASN